MSITSYTEARRKINDAVNELNGVAETNTKARKYNLSDILPPQSSKGKFTPPSATGDKSGLIAVPTPDGSTHYFKDQKSADTFKHLAGIK